MKKYIFTIIIIITTQVSADTVIESAYFNNKTLNWNKAGSPYIIKGHLTLSSTTLNIDDAKIIIRNGSISLYNNSAVNTKNVFIENIADSYAFSLFNSKLYSNNTSISSNKFIEAYTSDIKINNLTSLFNGDKDFISLYNNSDFSLENSNIQNYKGNVLNIYSVNTAQVKNTEFINNTRVFGIHSANSLLINNNDFQQNKVAIESYITGGNFEDNYFQKENPIIYAYKEDAPTTENDILAGAFSIQLFSKVKNIKKPELCCSNIMFLPGVMGSRLYITETVDNQLWSQTEILMLKNFI